MPAITQKVCELCQARGGLSSWRIELGELGQLAAIGRKDRIGIHLRSGMLKEEPVDDRVLLGGVLSMCLGRLAPQE